MAEFKVKSVGDNEPTEQKITQEPQENKIDLRVKEPQDQVQEEVVSDVQEQPEAVNEQVEENVSVDVEQGSKEPLSDIGDREKAIEYLNEKYNLGLKDDQNSDIVEITPEVEALLKFQKDTGRGIGDYLELSKDYQKMDDNELIRNYLKQTKPHYDDDDISYHIEKNFSSTEDDSEQDIRSKKLELKEELYNARQHFESQKEKYYQPLESSSADVPEEYQEAFSFYGDYKKDQERKDIEVKKRGEFFQNETDKYFNQTEGFEFDLGDQKKTYKLSDKDSLKKQTSDITGFINRFVDKDGLIKDPAGYHRSMAMANNPDVFAKHFYEMGKAEAVGDLVKETKNIDMSVKQNTGSTEDGKVKFRAVSEDQGSRLRIKKRQ